MNATEQRIDPSLLSGLEKTNLPRLVHLFHEEKNAPKLVSARGESIELPKQVYDYLRYVVDTLTTGQAIILSADKEAFTTQAAANYLGMSRQYFVTLLERGEIPFHKVGAHRRVYFKDLLDYENRRNFSRRAGLDNLFSKVKSAGLDDASYQGDAER